MSDGERQRTQTVPEVQLANIQALRGLAAFLIAAYHVQPLLNMVYGQSLHSRFAVFGVDIFFVISGFVMFYSNRTMTRAAAPFFADRLLRIAPLYWLATACIIALFLVGFQPVGLHLLTPRMIAESLLFIPSSFPDGRRDLILSVGWTLMYELFFYLCFALTFRLGSMARSFGVLCLGFAALIALGRLVEGLPPLAQFYTAPILVEFLYGAALAIAYVRWREHRPGWLAPLGLALLLAGFALSLAMDFARVPVPNKADARFLILGGPALLVVAGALAMERGGWAWRSRLPLLIGAASYALYLFHPLLLHIVVKLSALILPRAAGSALVAAIVALAACVVAAIVIHLLIERPVLRAGKRLIAGRLARRSDKPAIKAGLAAPAER